MKRFVVTAILVSLFARTGVSAEAEGQPSKKDARPQRVGDAYPLAVCPVSGKKLGSMGEPVIQLREGREVRFCCPGCVPAFEKDPAAVLKKIDEAIVKQQKPFYPLETCVVSGEKLGSMGKPVDVVVGNRLVVLCCNGCTAKLLKKPAAYLAKLNKAVIEKQKSSYPLDTCAVSGEKLGSMGEPIEYVHANRLVRLCCKGCIAKFDKDPVKYLKAIDEALKKKEG